MAWLEKEGYCENSAYPKLIRRLAKCGANLLDPEHVKPVIAKQPWKKGTKMLAVYAYDAMVKMLKTEWSHVQVLPGGKEKSRQKPAESKAVSNVF